MVHMHYLPKCSVTVYAKIVVFLLVIAFRPIRESFTSGLGFSKEGKTNDELNSI